MLGRHVQYCNKRQHGQSDIHSDPSHGRFLLLRAVLCVVSASREALEHFSLPM